MKASTHCLIDSRCSRNVARMSVYALISARCCVHPTCPVPQTNSGGLSWSPDVHTQVISWDEKLYCCVFIFGPPSVANPRSLSLLSNPVSPTKCNLPSSGRITDGIHSSTLARDMVFAIDPLQLPRWGMKLEESIVSSTSIDERFQRLSEKTFDKQFT